MKAVVVDTEVSQLEKPEVIELAYQEAELITTGFSRVGTSFCQRYKPTFKLSCGAMAVHHIIPEDLTACDPSSTAKLPECEYIIGHNVDFDWTVLGQPNVRRICTLAFARSYWPEVEGHTLGACMYRIMPFKEARELVKSAHSASYDVKMCEILLDYFIKEYMPSVARFEDLWQLSEEARLPKFWSFGKHKGKKFEDADKGYMSWCVKQPDMDPYVVKRCKQLLGK